MSYTLRFAKPFLKTLKSLDQAIIRRIHQRLQELAQDPCDLRLSGQVEMQQGGRLAHLLRIERSKPCHRYSCGSPQTDSL